MNNRLNLIDKDALNFRGIARQSGKGSTSSNTAQAYNGHPVISIPSWHPKTCRKSVTTNFAWQRVSGAIQNKTKHSVTQSHELARCVSDQSSRQKILQPVERHECERRDGDGQDRHQVSHMSISDDTSKIKRQKRNSETYRFEEYFHLRLISHCGRIKSDFCRITMPKRLQMAPGSIV